ncbi:MAG: fibronectin type III domain-containing protein, partial [Candidatus Doudnabacteria bacterium]|nr:fibronectin type III domain-containing protein [Candidatus Doudnabacteria bacterium]
MSGPTSLSVSNSTCKQLALNWNDNASGESGYRIYRGTSSGNLSELTTVPANRTSYTDPPPSVNQTYYYQVQAYQGSGPDSPRSNEADAMNLPCSANLNNSSYTL